MELNPVDRKQISCSKIRKVGLFYRILYYLPLAILGEILYSRLDEGGTYEALFRKGSVY